MALLPIHKYFVFNGEIKSIEEFIPSENEGGIYEVLRVVNGVPLFLEDHLKRFWVSAKIAEKEIRFSENEIEHFLKKLIKKNKIRFGNILISCKTNLKIFYILHNYPLQEWYSNGVVCGTMHAERNNPNAKVFQTPVRQKANEMIAQKGFYEVMLIDHFGRITEGSRSNVFFVKGNQIVTPEGNRVLLGITRQKTILLAKKLGFNLYEKEVSISNLQTFEAAFITGTSPKILPIKQIDGILFNPQNEILQALIKNFDELIAGYINKFSG